jgi:hypothetical protein
VTATVFHAHQWTVFAAANLLLAATYALLGVCLGPVFGRVSGVFIAFLVPFLDLGIGQSPMLRGQPAGWAHALPGYGGYRVLLDGGLTNHFDTTGPLLTGLAWLAGLAVLATWLFRHTSQPGNAAPTRVTARPASRRGAPGAAGASATAEDGTTTLGRWHGTPEGGERSAGTAGGRAERAAARARLRGAGRTQPRPPRHRTLRSCPPLLAVAGRGLPRRPPVELLLADLSLLRT